MTPKDRESTWLLYLLGELPDDDATALESTLAEDPAARAELEMTSWLLIQLDAALVAPEAAEHLADRILERVTPTIPHPRSRIFPGRMIQIGWALAACLLAALGLWWVWPNLQQQDNSVHSPPQRNTNRDHQSG